MKKNLNKKKIFLLYYKLKKMMKCINLYLKI